jgi:biotin carboxylase
VKTILILGAGFLQSFVIRKAKEIGYRVLTVDKDPKAPGFDYADKYAVIDIVDQDACLLYAQHHHVDGVITAATDYGVLSAAYIAAKMNLPGLKYDVAKVIKNKFLVRRLLASAFRGNTQFFEISNLSELDNIIGMIRYPVMIKPCDGSGSKGTVRVDNSEDLLAACQEAQRNSVTGKVLIEDFVFGTEYGVESFVYQGQVHVMGILGKNMTPPPIYAELGHFYPSQLPTEPYIEEVVKTAIRSLGINFGAVNMDIIVGPNGQGTIIDIGARMGGNLIGSHIIPLGTGVDYMGNLIRATVGDPIRLDPICSAKNVATRLLALTPGEVALLPDFEAIGVKHGVRIYSNLKTGDMICPYRTNLDGCGYVLAVASDVYEARKMVNEALLEIDAAIERR